MKTPINLEEKIDSGFLNTHGENLQLTISDFHSLVDKIDELTYMYKTDLENAVLTQKFKRLRSNCCAKYS